MSKLLVTLKEAFFDYKTGSRAGLFVQFVLSALLLACLLRLWSGFLPPEKVFNAPDWQKEYDYYSVLKQAITEGKRWWTAENRFPSGSHSSSGNSTTQRKLY